MGAKASVKWRFGIEHIAYESSSNSLESKLKITPAELNEAIQSLTEIQQDVILGRYILGKSLAELSQKFGVTPNTMYKRHSDALKNLRKILGSTRH